MEPHAGPQVVQRCQIFLIKRDRWLCPSRFSPTKQSQAGLSLPQKLLNLNHKPRTSSLFQHVAGTDNRRLQHDSALSHARNLLSNDLLLEGTRAWEQHPILVICAPALEATQRQNDSCFSQLPYKCYLEEVAFVGD